MIKDFLSHLRTVFINRLNRSTELGRFVRKVLKHFGFKNFPFLKGKIRKRREESRIGSPKPM
ncbi:hypothetical protein DLM78_19055 [Leptospira stimsonii]|uniref:Uncharacterized protein n=1 Tax=Leptospira stimsonii TaxID=2202203 RepID=A0A8B3CP24_9LEPT|nr:hypothetical protein DLM78_19055 [Leptospira stimsonii]